MLTIIIFIVVGIYVLELLLLLIGLSKADHVHINDTFKPSVSIIVAARNEEDVILDCIDSLVKIKYPSEKLEVILVNDCSTDKTLEIIHSQTKIHSRLRVISTIPGDGNLRGKTNALNQGIQASTGEILMFTDADCRVPPAWVQETVKYFTPSTGIVGGFTLLDAHRPFEAMQTLDWIFLFGLASATAGLNIPLTVIGNNLSLRRSAYDQTGGFSNIPFSVTEDYALVQAVIQRTSFHVLFPINPRSLVKSHACPNLRHLFRQKQRWGIGGLDMVTRGFMIMAIGWMAKFALIVSIPFVPFSTWLIGMLGMIIIETMFISKPLRRLHSLKSLRAAPIFLIYFFIYVLIIPFIAFFSKHVIWKERDLA